MTIKEFYEKQAANKLDELSQTPPTSNIHYQRVIEKIIDRYDNEVSAIANNCFNFGMETGRSLENELITWNATATFFNMKSYASQHNGSLPDSQKQLHEWLQKRLADFGITEGEQGE